MATYNVAKQFSPRRGSATGMTAADKKSIVLAAGELFVEYPDTGVGSGPVKVKIGDGTTDYEHLAYAIEPPEYSTAIVIYNDSTATTVSTALAQAASGHALNQIVPGLKKAIQLVDGAAVYKLTVDGNDLTPSSGTVTFNTPDYAIGTSSATGGANLTLTPSSGYGKDASTISVTGDGITVANSGTAGITITHPVSGVTSGSYASVTVNANGHVTSGSTITSGKAVISDANGLPAASSVTATELGYVSGVTSGIQDQLNALSSGKADAVHTHVAADITDDIPVTMLTSGANGEKISIDLIPHGALERLIHTTNETSMRALTADDVQVGDTVKREDTGIMYFCIKSQGLPVGSTGDISEFFEEYTAGEASSVEWSNVQNKPGNFTGATSTSAGAYGFVPAPSSGEEGYFLAGDGSWTAFSSFSGATSAADGAMGMVPAPTSGNQDKYLQANGSWSTPTDTTYGLATTAAAGLMPTLTTASNVYLKGDGSWDTPIDTTYGAATTAEAGLMPALSTADSVYLAGDGTWKTIAAATTAAAGLMPALSTANDVILAGDGSWINIGVYDFGDETPSV